MKNNSFKARVRIFACWLLIVAPTASVAAPKIFKIATQAPQGSSWANNLQELAGEISSKTQGRVVFKIYYGGVAGDEAGVLRKLRIGQMQGSLFMGRTLGQIYSDVRIMEVPLSFKHDGERASRVFRALTPTLNKGIESRGFKNLGFFEAGKVYLVSTKKVANFKQLRGVKVWFWEGDELASLFFEKMKLISVPLALPDVLTALSTGIVDAAYASPMGILALQWNSKVKYLIDFPVTYAIGAFLVSMKEWNKVSARDRAIVEKIVSASMQKNTRDTLLENTGALEALRSVGVEFVKLPNSDIAEADQLAQSLLSKLQAQKVLSAEIISLARKASEETPK